MAEAVRASAMIAGVVGEVNGGDWVCGQDAHAPCHIAIGIVDDGLAVDGGEAVVVIIGCCEGGMLPGALDEGGAEAGFGLSGKIVLEGEVRNEFSTKALAD
jgi:hypothetical protein